MSFVRNKAHHQMAPAAYIIQGLPVPQGQSPPLPGLLGLKDPQLQPPLPASHSPTLHPFDAACFLVYMPHSLKPSAFASVVSGNQTASLTPRPPGNLPWILLSQVQMQGALGILPFLLPFPTAPFGPSC